MIIPSHLDDGTRPITDGGNLSNTKLRIGQIKNIYNPGTSYNINKRVPEYAVLVQHRENGTGVSKLYDHCTALEGMGSNQADIFYHTYRPDQNDFNIGSQVLLLCINGEAFNAVILGSIRSNQADPEDSTGTLGHHLHFVFNGIQINIDKDGQLLLNIKGPTDINGDVTNENGTSVQITSDGSVTVADNNKKNVIFLDKPNGKVQITTENEIDLSSNNIKIGSTSSSEPLVLGNQLNDWVQQLISAISTLTVFTAMGTSSPPVNAAIFEELGQQFVENLSNKCFTE